jgi:C4-dicarboxylate-binding protein DctP
MNGLKLGVIVCVAVALLLMPILGASADAKVYVIKFATAHPPMIPSGSFLLELEKAIPEKTNGRVKFKPFLGSALYGDYEAPPQIQAGALEMAFGGYNLSAVSKGWNTLAGLPYFIDDYEHYLRFCKTDAFKTMIGKLQTKGIKHLAQAGHPGFANAFNGVRPIKKLEDFKGLKMRIPPIPGLVKMCEGLGVRNVTVTIAEVSTALQTGMADGTFAPVMKLKGYDLINNTPYVTICNTSFIPQTFIVNTNFWNSLPADLKKILQSVFEEYGEKMNQAFRVMEEKLWAKYKAGPGTTVTELDQTEKARWLAAARPVWEEEKNKSDEVRMIVEAVEATR